MKYRYKRTGAILESDQVIKGENWELVEAPSSPSDQEEEKPVAPKKRKKKE